MSENSFAAIDRIVAHADHLNTDGEIDEATIAADDLFNELVAEHNAQNARDRAWDAFKDTVIEFSMAHPADPPWKQKNRLQSNFKNYKATANEIVAVMLQPHKTGVDKNAVNALAGVLINDAPIEKGKNLSDENIKQIGLAIYECDNGTTPEEFSATLKSEGFAHVIYSTHNNGATTRAVRKDPLLKHMAENGRGGESPTAADVTAFLLAEGKVTEAQARSVHGDPVFGTYAFSNGLLAQGYEFSVDPYDKFRCGLFMTKPVDIVTPTSIGSRKALYSETYVEFPAMLGLTVDTACQNVSRLQFLPSAKRPEMAYAWFVAGGPVDFNAGMAWIEANRDAIKPGDKSSKASGTKSTAGGVVGGAKKQKYKRRAELTGDVKDLGLFRAVCRSFDPIPLLTSDAGRESFPETALALESAKPNEKGIVHCPCPNHDGALNGTGHSSVNATQFGIVLDKNRPADSPHKGKSAVIMCGSEGCKTDYGDKTGVDYWKFIEAVCFAMGIYDAVELLPYVSDETEREGFANIRVSISPGNQAEVAAKFMADECPHLIRYRGEFLDYRDGAYVGVADETVDSALLSWLQTRKVVQVDEDGNTAYVPYIPSVGKMGSVLEMLRKLTHIADDRYELPCWREGYDDPDFPPNRVLVCGSKIVNMITGKARHITPNFLTRNRTDCEFDPFAECPLWEKTVNEQWFPGQPADVETIQEFGGLCLINEMKHHKGLLIIGVKRSGKGTFLGLIKEVVGLRSVTSPSISSLGQPFGLQPLIGKTLAIVADARLARNANLELTENILRIIGGDGVNINRKHLGELIDVQLQTRFIVTTNEMPKFTDDTGTVTTRFIPVSMKNSFFRKEDKTLAARLRKELPGILNWFRRGLLALEERGHLTESSASLENSELLERMASPIKAWAEDCAEIDGTGLKGWFSVTADLYSDYAQWCERMNQRPLPGHEFGEKVRQVGPLEPHRETTGKRLKGYKNIRLISSETFRR